MAGGTLAAVAVAVGAWRGQGRPVWLWPVIGVVVLTWWVLRVGGLLAGRGALVALASAGPRLRVPGFRRRVPDPETAELIEREAVIPARTPKVKQLGHGCHWTPAGVLQGVHKVKVGEAGAGKGQTDVNYEIQFQLQHSDEHLIILEVKPNLELTKVVAAYARPEDRLWIYTMQPRNRLSSALAVTDLREVKDLAHAICFEPGSKDPHWNSKAAALLPAAAVGLTELKGHDVARGVSATLGEVRDTVTDREALEALRKACPLVDNVADEAKEWGYIRSTAARHLDALSEARVRRVFAGNTRTPQPTFGTYPDGGRDVVVVRPHEASAARESRYVVAVLDILLRRAAEGGYEGGPGTKALLDEFASFLDLSKMRRYLDLGRGGKLQMSYVLQGLDQLAAAVGTVEAKSIISNTEIKMVGATSDLELARMISDLSGKSRVEFRGLRERGHLLARWSQESRSNVLPEEITRQRAGEWTIVHRGEVRKVRVDARHYHHTQAAPAGKVTMKGALRPEAYAPPGTHGGR